MNFHSNQHKINLKIHTFIQNQYARFNKRPIKTLILSARPLAIIFNMYLTSIMMGFSVQCD